MHVILQVFSIRLPSLFIVLALVLHFFVPCCAVPSFLASSLIYILYSSFRVLARCSSSVVSVRKSLQSSSPHRLILSCFISAHLRSSVVFLEPKSSLSSSFSFAFRTLNYPSNSVENSYNYNPHRQPYAVR